jgi:predicted nucleic acid-binding protein
MIAYIDTSTFIKLIIEEEGSEVAGKLWDQADQLATNQLLYVEARAALAAAHRGRRIANDHYREAARLLDELWQQLDAVEIDEPLIATAAQLAERHRLRGYDAVHLASALRVGAEVLSSADGQLCEAALAEGLHIANPLERTGESVSTTQSGASDPLEFAVDVPYATPPTDVRPRMTTISDYFDIPIPDNAVSLPPPGEGWEAASIGTIEDVTAFYKDYMSTDGWIFDSEFSELEPYWSENELMMGYITNAFYVKPTDPITTVGITIGNADGKPGRKRDVRIYITETPDDELPYTATRLHPGTPPRRLHPTPRQRRAALAEPEATEP